METTVAVRELTDKLLRLEQEVAELRQVEQEVAELRQEVAELKKKTASNGQATITDHLAGKESTQQRPEINGRRVSPPVPYKDRSREYEWLKEHAREYARQWVALEGDQLISYGSNAAEVFAAADASGVERPFFVHIEDPDGPPFAGV
jgi:hypothetical protein